MPGFDFGSFDWANPYETELQKRLKEGPDFSPLDALKTPDYGASDKQYAETLKLRDRLLSESTQLKQEAAGLQYEKPKLRERALTALSGALMAFASNNPGMTGAQMIQQIRDTEMAKQDRIDRYRARLEETADQKTLQAIQISQALGDEYGERAAKAADIWNSGALQMITNDQREAAEIVQTLTSFGHDQAKAMLDAQVQYSLEEFRQKGYMDRLRTEYELRGEMNDVEWERALTGAYRDKLMGKLISYGLIGPQYKRMVEKMSNEQPLDAAEFSALEVFSIMDRNARELDIDQAKQKTIMQLVGRDRPVLDENGMPKMDVREDKILTQPITYEEALTLFQQATGGAESRYRQAFGMEASTATTPAPKEFQDPTFQANKGNELIARGMGVVDRLISEGRRPEDAIKVVVGAMEAEGTAPEIVHQFQERVFEALDIQASTAQGQPVPQLTERGLTQNSEAVIQQYAEKTRQPLVDLMSQVQQEVQGMDPAQAEQYIQQQYGQSLIGKAADFAAKAPAAYFFPQVMQ